MKRKQIDAGGKVVEVDAPAPAEQPAVVGTIGEPVTDPLEIPPKATRMAVPPVVPSLGPWGEFLAQLAALHIIVARFIRRKVLLIDLDQHEANQMRQVMTMVAQQHHGFSEMMRDVRLRLAHHERTVPLLGESRRRLDAQLTIRQKKIDNDLLAAQRAAADDPEAP